MTITNGRNSQQNDSSTKGYQAPFTAFSISAECWNVIRELLRPGMVTLECGSGLSTLFFEAAGCIHTALEHDPAFASLSNCIINVPLTGNPSWYDWNPSQAYDLIFIDGPPGEYGREGILRVLKDCLHKDTVIILDDVNRKGEQELAERISGLFKLRLQTSSPAEDCRSFAICSPEHLSISASKGDSSKTNKPTAKTTLIRNYLGNDSQAELLEEKEGILKNRFELNSHNIFAQPEQKNVSVDAMISALPREADSILIISQESDQLVQRMEAKESQRVISIDLAHELNNLDSNSLQHKISQAINTLRKEPHKHLFDCIVLDELEKFSDPRTILIALRDLLKENGKLISTVPNVRHHHSVSSLLNGTWLGNADQSQKVKSKKYFTRRELEKLFYLAQFELCQLIPVFDDDLRAWRDQGYPGKVNLNGLCVSGLKREDAEEFHTKHFIITAIKKERSSHELTSIVMLTHNQLSYTHQCLESIRFFTAEPYELIVIDNGSTDGTVNYLRSQKDIRVIENPENNGFPAACNQGINAAQGEQILLLNNDVIVTTGWLDRMLRVLQSDSNIGLVGPCTNNISGAQQVPVNYSDLASLDGFAWGWAKEHTGEIEDLDRLVGFCLLFTRQLVEKVGLLDERFGLGNFEDDDYCRRARQKDYRTVLAKEVFIHHFGSVTYRSNGVDFQSLLQKNEKIYEEKWSNENNGYQSVSEQPQPEGLESSQEAINKKPPAFPTKNIKLSLCMIVRDSSRTLGACLKSIKPWVDEMIVVDTGSIDNTCEIAQEYGAKLFHMPWCDDFAKARNRSLEHAQGEWLFWMDSDDTIDAENGSKLRRLVESASSNNPMGYVMQVRCPGPGLAEETDVTVVDHVKLFRNLPELRFEGRIHEQILPAIRRIGGEVEWSDAFVVHSGADHTVDGLKAKHERDLRLLNLQLEDQPDHSFTLFNLGMTLADRGDFQEAITALERSEKVSSPAESHVRKLYALLVSSHSRLGSHEEAWHWCQKGRQQFPDDVELVFREGILSHHRGDYLLAEKAYLDILNGSRDRYFCSVDRGILGFKARHNLALVYKDMGQLVDAEKQWWKVTEEMPSFKIAWSELGSNLIQQNRIEAANALVARLEQEDYLFIESLLLQAEIAAVSGKKERELDLMREAVHKAVDDTEPLRRLSKLLFEGGDLAEAENKLLNLAHREPNDGSVHHNLGTVYLRQERYEDAVRCYRQSLEVRPDWPQTYRDLSQALELSGRKAEAGTALSHAQRLSPEKLHSGSLRQHSKVNIPNRSKVLIESKS